MRKLTGNMKGSKTSCPSWDNSPQGQSRECNTWINMDHVRKENGPPQLLSRFPHHRPILTAALTGPSRRRGRQLGSTGEDGISAEKASVHAVRSEVLAVYMEHIVWSIYGAWRHAVWGRCTSVCLELRWIMYLLVDLQMIEPKLREL